MYLNPETYIFLVVASMILKKKDIEDSLKHKLYERVFSIYYAFDGGWVFRNR